MKLTFEIILESDYHIGAGFGLPPEVDSALHRDPDGVPVIRGTILVGLLRQGLYDLLQLSVLRKYRRCKSSGAPGATDDYCGQWHSDDEVCPICAVFGTPRQKKRWRVSSARPMPLEVQQKSSYHWHPGETGAQVTTRVRVNPRTRRVEGKKLFTREEGDGRLVFGFTAECLADDVTAWQQAAWLAAAARMVRRLGAGKRRGLGECGIRIVGNDAAGKTWQDELLDRFASILNDEVTPKVSDGALQVPEVGSPAQGGQHNFRVRVLVRTDEPLLIARRAEAGNQFETVNTIPGSALRGALAWRIAERFGAQMDNDDTYESFVKLFFRDMVYFSTLHPITIHRGRGYLNIPIPRDLLTCELFPGYEKSGGHGVWSRAWEEKVRSDCPQCQQPGSKQKTKLKELTAFISLNKARPQINASPAKAVEMHIRIDPRNGRVQPNILFGYVALEPGQYFVGEITCHDDATWRALQVMADLVDPDSNEVQQLRLGKATRRGHGKVSVVWQPGRKSLWHDKGISERVTDRNKVVMTLLSDVIVLDRWGRNVQGFSADWLHQALGLPDTASVSVDVERSFSANRPINAFNAKIGLPRARDMALVTGSSVRLSFEGMDLATLQQHLSKVEAASIGLRRGEGFGQVVFNHPIYLQPEDWDFETLDLSALSLATGKHGLKEIAKFRMDWEDHLDEAFKEEQYEYELFEATARIIHVTPGGQAVGLADRLWKMGEQTEVLAQSLKGRDKTNFYQKGDGKPGMEAISQLLERLGELVEQHTKAGADRYHLWKVGLEMLADRIAAPARKKAEDRR